MGTCYFKLKAYDKAVECFKKAILSDPFCAIDYANLCLILKELNKREEAIYYGEKALELDPELEFVKKILNYDGNKKYIICSVGSRGKHKIWPTEYFSELITMLSKHYTNLVFVFVGSKEDEDKTNDVIKCLCKIDYINLVGQTSLKELCAVVSFSTLTISNDNGVAHVSAALDKPTLILFGPSNPKWFYPYNEKSTYIYKPTKCSPCGIKTLCKNNICMKQVIPLEVFKHIKEKFDKILQ